MLVLVWLLAFWLIFFTAISFEPHNLDIYSSVGISDNPGRIIFVLRLFNIAEVFSVPYIWLSWVIDCKPAVKLILADLIVLTKFDILGINPKLAISSAKIWIGISYELSKNASNIFEVIDAI